MKHKYNINTMNIVFSGMMLGIAILFDFLSSYMPLVPNLMYINLSLIPILLVFVISGWYYGTILLVARFLLALPMSDGPILSETWGNFVGFLSAFVYIGLFMLFRHLKLSKKYEDSKFFIFFRKSFFFRWTKYLKINFNIVHGLIMTSLLAALIMSFFNVLIGVPVWIATFTGEYTFNIEKIGPIWGIKNYFAVVFTLYLVGNLINYAIASFMYYTLRPAIHKIRPFINETN